MQHLVHGSDLFSIVDGVIIDKGYDSAGYGYYIVMKDLTTNQGFLYGHMREASPLNIGDSVIYGQYVGHEGTTGNSTGIHLHLEQENLGSSMTYQYNLPIGDMIDPSIYLGIPNTQGISAIYYGTPIFPKKKKKKFPWVIYANKIRKRNNLTF